MDRNDERRNKVFLEPLPYDFLRLSGTSEREQQEAADQQAALALQQQLSGQLPATTATNVPASQYYQNIAGFLSITVTQAKLVKNYGMTRMDPYVRLRIGHSTYETHTDPNGGKNPRWNKVIHSMLPQGLNNMYIEIYDECSFTLDELIAFTNVTIPPAVLKGETREDWFPLSGKQGEGMEGMLHLVLSFSTSPPNSYTYQQMPPVMVHSTMYGAGPAMPVYVAPQMTNHPVVAPQQQVSPEKRELVTAADLKQIGEMFPHLDTEVIKSVYDSSRGNKDTTINCLLQLNE